MRICANDTRNEVMTHTYITTVDDSTARFNIDGQIVDVLDLKTLLITRGINVPEEITTRFGRTH